jgi:drug/metabolite transporter (DMT)-like permease
MPSSRRLAEVLLFLVTIVWGSTFIVMKNGSAEFSPVDFVFFRFLVATLLCIVFFHHRIATLRWKSIGKGAFIGLFLFLGILMQVWGLQSTSASNSAFITGLVVITVPLLHSLMSRRRPASGTALGALLAITGIGFLSGVLPELRFDRLALGDLLTLIGTLAWTVQVVALDRLVDGEDAYALSFMQFLTVTVVAGIVMTVSGSSLPEVSMIPWFAVLFTGIAGTFLAFTVQTVFQFRTTPYRAVLIFSFEPVFGLMFALLIPGIAGTTETLTLVKTVGCLLVLAGMLASEFLPLRSKDAA